jgi:regulation of enolase protein 1 (concanavalin A-like superfamily)
MTINGKQILLSVPAGGSHDLWEKANTAPRLMQSINDDDFDIEVKFDTSVNFKYQLQGVIIEQDDKNLLRFDFFSDGKDSYVFYAKFENGKVVESTEQLVSSGSPMYMRIRRSGDVFSQDYKVGAESWQSHVGISYEDLQVKKAGVFAGNSGNKSIPAFTSAVDYFFDSASPIAPEDADSNTIFINSVGQGLAGTYPIKSSYNCGEEVIIGALPDQGWVFKGWSGELAGRPNPYYWTVDGDLSGTAIFEEATDFVWLPSIFNGDLGN